MSSAVFLYEFNMRGHDFRAYWMPTQARWFVQNRRAEFDFPGREDDGLGKVKAGLKCVLRVQYQYLLDNAHRVKVRIKGAEGYLNTFPFRVRRKWAEGAILLPRS